MALVGQQDIEYKRLLLNDMIVAAVVINGWIIKNGCDRFHRNNKLSSNRV